MQRTLRIGRGSELTACFPTRLSPLLYRAALFDSPSLFPLLSLVLAALFRRPDRRTPQPQQRPRPVRPLRHGGDCERQDRGATVLPDQPRAGINMHPLRANANALLFDLPKPCALRAAGCGGGRTLRQREVLLMPPLTLSAFWCDDDEQDAPDFVVLVSPYEAGPRAMLVRRRRGDE